MPEDNDENDDNDDDNEDDDYEEVTVSRNLLAFMVREFVFHPVILIVSLLSNSKR